MGTYQDKRSGSWIARTRTVNGKREYLGAFKTREEADRAFQVSEKVHELEFVHPLYDRDELQFELPKDTRSLFQRIFRRA